MSEEQVRINADLGEHFSVRRTHWINIPNIDAPH